MLNVVPKILHGHFLKGKLTFFNFNNLLKYIYIQECSGTAKLGRIVSRQRLERSEICNSLPTCLIRDNLNITHIVT